MRGDRYGLLKAAELAAEMVGQYERARDGAIEIRVESLQEAIWDDIHVVRSHHIDKWQVKRLKEKFDAGDVAEVIKSALDCVEDVPTDLHLGVLRFVPVKKGSKELFGLQDLAELCQEARNDGLAPAAFAARERSGSAYNFVETSLPDGNPDTILPILQRLRVEELGLEERLRERAAAHLQDIFLNAEELVIQIHNWFLQHPDGAIVVNIPLLYEQVIDRHGRRDATRPRWIQLSRNAVKPQWTVQGAAGS